MTRARAYMSQKSFPWSFLQSMHIRFSDSEQWGSPAKPPRSQNYVKPHDARTRVHVGKVVEGIAPCRKDRLSWAGPPSAYASEASKARGPGSPGRPQPP